MLFVKIAQESRKAICRNPEGSKDYMNEPVCVLTVIE